MGSHLYVDIVVQQPGGSWHEIFTGRSTFLAKGPVVEHFGSLDPDEPSYSGEGYLTHDQIVERQQHEECPWRLQEPYWVRQVSGASFLFDSNRIGTETCYELRAFAAMVASLIADGFEVHVWCCHSQ